MSDVNKILPTHFQNAHCCTFFSHCWSSSAASANRSYNCSIAYHDFPVQFRLPIHRSQQVALTIDICETCYLSKCET